MWVLAKCEIDVIVILNSLFSNPSMRKSETLTPICMPGVADDGYVYAYIRHLNANLGIFFISLEQDNFYECSKKASEIFSV